MVRQTPRRASGPTSTLGLTGCAGNGRRRDHACANPQPEQLDAACEAMPLVAQRISASCEELVCVLLNPHVESRVSTIHRKVKRALARCRCEGDVEQFAS